MLETRKVDTQDTQGAIRKPTSIRYVTGMRQAYLDKYSGSTDVSYFSGK